MTRALARFIGAVLSTLMLLLTGCASVPAERKATIQDMSQSGLSVAVVSRLFVATDRKDPSSRKAVQDQLIDESVRAGQVLKQNMRLALEHRGLAVRRSLFVRTGQNAPVFLDSYVCRRFANVATYDEASQQKPSQEKCTGLGDDSQQIAAALPYLSVEWDEPMGDNMPGPVVSQLSAAIDARYLMVFFYSGYLRTESVKRSHALLKAFTMLSPQGLADALAKSLSGTVDESRRYAVVLYDTAGGRLRRVFHQQRFSTERFVGTDPRAWTEAQLNQYLVDDLVKDKVFR